MMGGCSSDDAVDCISSDDLVESVSPLTLVLVGKTGNGKSATGNSVLGTKSFDSKRSSSGVTSICELKETQLPDGRVVDVIDTPGLFDSSVEFKFIEKEIVSCINMGMDGIHAFLVVFSVCCRFSDEEEAVINSLFALFGKEVCDYLIIVFTGGDDLDNDGKTLEDFLCDCPKPLKEILRSCGNRSVLFDNRTNDQTKKTGQVKQLFDLVNKVLEKNGGRPYTNETFTVLKELQKQTEKFHALKVTKHHSEEQVQVLIEQMREKQMKQIFDMIQLKLDELIEIQKAAHATGNSAGVKKKSCVIL